MTKPDPTPKPTPETDPRLEQEIAALIEYERRRGTPEPRITMQVIQHRKRVAAK
jgi:hypothetical protein